LHKLFARQLAKATRPSGEPDLEALAGLVSAAYEQSDRDQRRTERSMSLMIEELDQLNRSLGKLVEERILAAATGQGAGLQRDARVSVQSAPPHRGPAAAVAVAAGEEGGRDRRAAQRLMPGISTLDRKPKIF
jgi:hypothetical protein